MLTERRLWREPSFDLMGKVFRVNWLYVLLLCALAFAADREIIVSRGELVEIGDGFRIPDLLTCVGARLREVGTTNRCTVRDYADAIGPQTGFILKDSNARLLVTADRWRGLDYLAAVPGYQAAGPPLEHVVVVGGGTTGPIAAVAAARRNKKVVLIERFGSLGGNLTLGLNTKPSGALVGGLIIGIVENFAAGYLDPYVGGGTKDFAPYVVMILVLMIRPYGIFGRRQIERV